MQGMVCGRFLAANYLSTNSMMDMNKIDIAALERAAMSK
jgi:hypothetical protein